MTVKMIPELTGSSVTVSIAWGADLTDVDGSGWTWTDVTTDVRIDDGIGVVFGRKDEASTASPTQITMTLDNASGNYSLAGTSSNWPNVRRNTPVRVIWDTGTSPSHQIGFQGYAVGFSPGWTDDNGKIPVVKLIAAGLLRQLAQGNDPLHSSLYRQYTLTPPSGLLDYWPLEEDKTAQVGVSETGGVDAYTQPVDDGGTIYGKTDWGADTDNPATERSVQVSAGATIYCPTVDPSQYDSAGTWAVKWCMRYTSVSGAGVRIPFVGAYQCALNFFTDGNVDVVYSPAGGLSDVTVASYDAAADFTQWDDVWLTWTFFVDNTTTQPTWILLLNGVSVASAAVTSAKSVPIGMNVESDPDPGGTEDPISVGHVAIFSNPDSTLWTERGPETAWQGEAAIARLLRLGTEQGFQVTYVGGGNDPAMGPQLPKSITDLLRECETADQGVLVDGLLGSPGLFYVSRTARENASAAFALNATELAPPFQPTDDDQRTINRVTASIANSKYTFSDVTGRMGTDAIGVYDSSLTVNIADQTEVLNYASWGVHLGTVEGYRYPTMLIDLRAIPAEAEYLASMFTGGLVSKRILVDNTAGTIVGVPAEIIDLLVEGCSIQADPFNWRMTLNMSPNDPWRIAVTAATTGDTGEYLFRLESDGASVHTSASAGATTLTVTTPSGPFWTTTADDYPLDLSVGGVKVHTTACTAASGTNQTFTCSALSVARASGLPVELWDQPVLGL
jgi:hypothetical protein